MNGLNELSGMIDAIYNNKRVTLNSSVLLSVMEGMYVFNPTKIEIISRKKNIEDFVKINIPYYWIRLKVKPNIVTRVMDVNPKLKSEYDKLRNLLNHQYWWRFDKYKDRWYHWNIAKERYFIKAETYKILKENEE